MSFQKEEEEEEEVKREIVINHEPPSPALSSHISNKEYCKCHSYRSLRSHYTFYHILHSC